MSEAIERGKGPGVGLKEIHEALRGHKHIDWGIAYMCGLMDEGELDFDPPYQRGHVWTLDQQKDFVGFVLEGGRAPEVFVRELALNDDVTPPFYEVIDGKQRMTAFYKWWKGELPARLSEDWKRREVWVTHLDKVELRRLSMGGMSTSVQFLVGVSDAETMRFYLRLNRGGTVHTEEEIAQVRKLYEEAVGLEKGKP